MLTVNWPKIAVSLIERSMRSTATRTLSEARWAPPPSHDEEVTSLTFKSQRESNCFDNETSSLWDRRRQRQTWHRTRVSSSVRNWTRSRFFVHTDYFCIACHPPRVCRYAGHQADDGLLSKAAFNASFVIGCTFIRADKPGCD